MLFFLFGSAVTVTLLLILYLKLSLDWCKENKYFFFFKEKSIINKLSFLNSNENQNCSLDGFSMNGPVVVVSTLLTNNSFRGKIWIAKKQL